MLARIIHFLKDDNSGQALVEFAIIFPIQLIFTFGVLQLLFLMVGHLMVNFAAYRVARTAAVYNCEHRAGTEAASHAADPKPQYGTMAEGAPCVNAARIILSPLCFTNTANQQKIHVPGWGGLRGSDAAADKVFVDAVRQGGAVTVTLTFYQELVFPFIDGLFGMVAPGGKKMFAKGSVGGAYFFPIKGRSTVRAPEFDTRPGAACYEYIF